MRRLHRADRRKSPAVVHHRTRRGRAEANHHHRGARDRRTTASSTRSVPRRRRAAMRLLHFGNDHVGRCAVEAQFESCGEGYCRFHGGKCLPLRDLSAHCERDSEGRKGYEPVSGGKGNGPMSASTRNRTHEQLLLEPERYELSAPAPYRFDLDRREFFKFLGAGVLVVSVLPTAVRTQESGASRQRRGDSLPNEIDAWLHIGEDGGVTVYTGKVEMGQNIRTSLSQAVAEELHLSIEKIELVMGDTQLTPFDMGTFGSRTTPTMNLQLRKVAAAACDVLIDLAAAEWKVDRSRLVADNGMVTDPQTKLSLEYAALTKGTQLTASLPAEDPLIPAAKWKVAGQSTPKVDGRNFVTGKHRYPSDQKLPEMLYGKVLRPPSFGATLLSVDSQQAEKMGATVVRDGNFVGVAAASSKLAADAVAAVQAEWKSEAQPSSKELFEYLRKNEIG